MDKKEACGDDYQLKGNTNTDFFFQKGKWHQVIERVKVNTASNHDGEVELWMDGHHSLLVTGLQFVNNGSKVDNLYFSTFHGGSTVDWAPVNDSYIWFDDVLVSTQVSDVFSPLSLGKSFASGSTITVSPLPIAAGSYLFVNGVPNGEISAELLDSSGKMVSMMEWSKEKVHIPKINAGVYFLRLYGPDFVAIKRIVVQ